MTPPQPNLATPRLSLILRPRIQPFRIQPFRIRPFRIRQVRIRQFQIRPYQIQTLRIQTLRIRLRRRIRPLPSRLNRNPKTTRKEH